MSEKTVCVVTGGGSGMGLEAAKQMPKDKIIVIAGRTVAKLEKALEELKDIGFAPTRWIPPTGRAFANWRNTPRPSARSETSSTPPA